MGYNNFSRPVTPVDQYLPISDEILARGAMETYNKAGQLGQKLAAYNSNLFGITTYGKDAEVLQNYENQFNQQVAELSKGDITSPQALSKFNSLISNFSNSPDILGIHERNATYNSELKAKKDAEAKGLSYTSPLIKDAQSYYSGDKYYTDKRFTRSGWVSPDTTKAMDEAVKAVTKQQYDPKTGFVTKTAKPEEVAANFYERMKNNPNYQKDLEYGFEQETEGVNWQDNGHQFVQGKVNKLTQQYNEALADGNQEAASLAQHELNRLQNLADPSLIGEELKKQAFQNHVNTQLEKVGYANDVLDFQKIERDPIDMKLLEHKLNRQQEIYKAIVPGALALGFSPEQIMSGKAVDAEGKVITVADAMQKAQDFKVAEAQAKSDITLQRQKELEAQKQDGRMSTLEYKTRNGFIRVKDTGAKQVQLDGEYVDKQTIKEGIEAENAKTIEKLINERKNLFGLGDNDGVDPAGWGDGGVWFTTDEKTGVRYANYEADAVVGGTKYKVPVSEIMKNLSDPSYKPVVIDEDGKYPNGNSLDADKIDKSNIPVYKTPSGQEVDVEGFTQEQIDQAIKDGKIKAQ